MPSNAQKRTLDEMANEAFEILRKYGPMGCGSLGSWLFPDATGAVNCSCPYARVAGRVTKRLEQQGRARYGKRGWEAIATSQAMEKCCDRCGCSSCVVDGNDAEVVWCTACGLMGFIVEHGGTVEDQIDVDWIDPCSGESWRT